MTLALPSKIRSSQGNRIAGGRQRDQTELELRGIV
jgi:hypothetical protein